MLDAADEFSDNTSEWLMIEHRLQSVKEKFDFLFVRSSREHREIKVNSPSLLFSLFISISQTNLVQTEDIKHAMMEINNELDHLESLNHSLEPVDEHETNASINRTKLHRFIRLHDDLDIVHERLINLNDRSNFLLSGDQLRIGNDLKLIFDRLNSIKRIVRIYLDRLEKSLSRTGVHNAFSSNNHSPMRTSNSNLQVRGNLPIEIKHFSRDFSVCINDYYLFFLFLLHLNQTVNIIGIVFVFIFILEKNPIST